MTAPVAPPAPAARPAAAPAADGGGAESAAPFASALDGALSENRAAVGEHAGEEGAEGTPDEATVPAGEVLPEVPAAAVPAALWALALGANHVAATAGEGPSAVPHGAAGSPPGLAVAAALAQGRADGLGPADEGDAPAPGAGVAAPGRPTTTGPPGGLPPTAAAQAQAQMQAALDAVVGTGRTAPAVVVAPVDAAPAPGTPTVPVPTAPADAAPSTPATAPTATALATPGAVPAAGALSAGAGDTGHESAGSGAPAGDGVPEATPAGVGAPAAAALPAVAKTDAATGPAATQAVSGQVARQVAVLRGAADGSHTMTLVLTPETLGPVEVSVTISAGTLDLTLRGAHEHGRSALLDALPDLRRDLEQAGLSVGNAEVDRDTGGSRFSDRSAQYGDRQQGFGDRGGQGSGEDRSRPWPGAADTTGGPTPPTRRTTSSGLDVRA